MSERELVGNIIDAAARARDYKSRAKVALDVRNAAIRVALAAGMSERQVCDAASISRGALRKIKG